MALNPVFMVMITTMFISESEEEGERVGVVNSACLFLRAELGRTQWWQRVPLSHGSPVRLLGYTKYGFEWDQVAKS